MTDDPLHEWFKTSLEAQITRMPRDRYLDDTAEREVLHRQAMVKWQQQLDGLKNARH